MRRPALACLAALALVGTPAQGQEPRAYALIIGITGYPNYDPPYRLHFADQDAQAFYDFIITPEGGAFPPGNVVLLKNQHATRTAIFQAVQDLAPRVGGEDVVYVFFSGHGEVDDETGYSYLMPYYANGALPSDGGIRADQFVEMVRSRLAANHLVFFIDACHAGAVVAGGLAKESPRNVTARLRQTWDSVRRRAEDVSMAFLSARSNQRSYEDSTLHHGVFTWFLLKGLAGEADNAPADGTVTAEELNDYLTAKVRDWVQRRLGSTQIPITSPNFVGSLPLRISATAAMSIAEQARAHFEQGWSLTNARDTAGAVREYVLAIQLDPGYASAYNNLGALLRHRGVRADSVMALYRAAARADPGFAMPHYNLGVSLTESAPREAMQEYREAIRLDPDDADAHNNLGNLLKKYQDVDAAIQEYREAILLKADHPYAHRNLGLALSQIGDLPNAIVSLREAVKYYGNRTRVQTELDSVLALQRSLNASISVARDSFRLDAAAWHQLMFLLHEEAHDFEGAYRLLHEADARGPASLSTKAELAEASFTTGRHDQAESLVTDLLAERRLSPQRQIVLRSLEIANLYALGRSALVPRKLQALADVVAAQPDTFDLQWRFGGTKFFLRQDAGLVAHRAWLLQLFNALERGKRGDILANLPAPRATAQLQWVNCQGDVWCPLNTVNLGHESFEGVEGVYVVWYGSSGRTVVRVGLGVIRSALWTLRSDPDVQKFAANGLFVTWARVSAEQQPGVEKYLVDIFDPLVGERFPYRTPIVANLPF